MGEFFNAVFYIPILNLLVFFYKLLEIAHIPGPLGFAIILLTIAIRLLLYPLMAAQMKSAKKMADLKPHLDALHVKHKDDKTKLQQAQLDLYKEHGVNPAAGCLPMLVQFPVLIALYQVFYQVLNNTDPTKVLDAINKILYVPALHLSAIDTNFFGIGLGVKPSQWQQHGMWLLAIPVITGLLQFWQTKLMMPQASPTVNSQELTINKNNQGDKQKEKTQDTAGEMQKQMAIIMPIMFGYFALQFPIGLALYWNVFGLFGIMQQLSVNRQNKPIIQ